VVKIALIGKYTVLSDAYLSVIKSLQHACMAANLKLALEWVEASNLEVGLRGAGGVWLVWGDGLGLGVGGMMGLV
jgi:CTP synthase (UTP-ammonia lyase)